MSTLTRAFLLHITTACVRAGCSSRLMQGQPRTPPACKHCLCCTSTVQGQACQPDIKGPCSNHAKCTMPHGPCVINDDSSVRRYAQGASVSPHSQPNQCNTNRHQITTHAVDSMAVTVKGWYRDQMCHQSHVCPSVTACLSRCHHPVRSLLLPQFSHDAVKVVRQCVCCCCQGPAGCECTRLTATALSKVCQCGCLVGSAQEGSWIAHVGLGGAGHQGAEAQAHGGGGGQGVSATW